MAVYQLPRFVLHEADGQRFLVDTQSERIVRLHADWAGEFAYSALDQLNRNPGYFVAFESEPAPRGMVLDAWLDAVSRTFSAEEIAAAVENSLVSRRAVA